MIKIKRIINIIATVLLWCCLLLCAALILLRIANVRAFVVRTGSMEPEIPTGSVCFVDCKTPFETIVVGDIIMFGVSDNMTVTHRVIRQENGALITKGDANNVEDSQPVTEENYLGKTVFHISKIGFLVEFLQSLGGKIVLGCVFMLLLSSSVMTGGDDETNEAE